MKYYSTLLGVAWLLLGAGPALATPSAPFTECPAIGGDTSCQFLIVVKAGGSITVLSDPSQQPFNLDGDDALIGVLNQSQSTLESLAITGSDSQGQGAFFFDGDGLCGIGTTPQPAGCPVATFGPTGYEGPGVSFGNMSSDLASGTVLFNGGAGLAAGESAYFSLQGGNLTAVSATLAPSAVPEPACWLLLATGVGLLPLLSRRPELRT